MQLYMATHGEPVRRLADHAQVSAPLLDGWTKLREANFRVGRFGRFEWTAERQDVYLQFFPPSLQDMVSPPEFMLQQMARAGVDRAVLQNARPYGRLNDYFADAARSYPDRFIGLADVDEAQAHTEAEITRLRTAVRELGLRGVYYANRAHFFDGYARGFDDRMFDPYWEEVSGLGIPVFWEVVGAPNPNDPAQLLTEMQRLTRVLERWPKMPGVWTHGFSPEILDAMPEPLEAVLSKDNLMVEILYPIHWARAHEYPFPELRPALQKLYQKVGGERLVWGSDMPNVERNCTYRQSLEYLRLNVDGWLPSADLDGILGLNVLRLLGAA
jgi:predicted TIM-barrel fold metal-dependent hydrolase